MRKDIIVALLLASTSEVSAVTSTVEAAHRNKQGNVADMFNFLETDATKHSKKKTSAKVLNPEAVPEAPKKTDFESVMEKSKATLATLMEKSV